MAARPGKPFDVQRRQLFCYYWHNVTSLYVINCATINIVINAYRMKRIVSSYFMIYDKME